MEWALDANKTKPMTGRMWPGLVKGRLAAAKGKKRAASVPATSVATAHRLISTGTSRAWGTVGGMCCGVGFALLLVPLLALSLGGAVARQRWLEPHWEGVMCAGFG